MGHQVVPLKAILPYYAQAANHPLPGDLIYADGSTLSIGTHGIAGGASAYTLPELRNYFIIGADRTKAPLDGGQYLNFITTPVASGNSYNYQNIDFPQHDYLVTSGDYLQYDVYYPSANIPAANPEAAVELYASDGSVLRNTTTLDQNGISQFGDFRAFATDQWYRRRIPMPGLWVGKTIQSFMLVHEYSGSFTNMTTRFQNIYITNTAGDQINYIAWQSGDGTPSYTTHVLASSTFVSGNASSLLAPGPEGTSGTHKRRLRSYHVPAHTHTGSSTSVGSHGHNCFMTGHAYHDHAADNGQNLAWSQNNTRAGGGSGFFQITCYSPSTGNGGAHGHTVSGGAAGSHGHSLSITTASSGGVNAASTAIDLRPRHYGVVWCLKSGKPTNRAQSIPMGTIIMWYADTQNETLPNSYSYCDGSALTSGNHSVPNEAGSMVYTLTLPDLRNRYLVGADRTKNFGQASSTTDAPSGAPGPGGTGGVHSFSLTVANFANHGHTGSTDTQWASHNHTFFVSGNSEHTHPPFWGYQTSTTGQQISLPGGGGLEINQYMATGIAGGLTGSDSHAHFFYIDGAGSHDHTITVNSNGSGTAFDNRSPFIGLVFLMKTTVGLASVPLKTVVAFRATAANESIVPTDGTWALCDGSTLTPGNFDMTANSGGNYVLPNFLNFFPLGADRTKAVANTGGTTNSATDAPGPKGTAGSATTTLSTSTMPGHGHLADDDVQGNHSHGYPVATSGDGFHAHGTVCHTYFCTTNLQIYTTGSSAYGLTPPEVEVYNAVTGGAVSSDHGASSDTQGAHSHAITVNSAGSGTAFQQRPRFAGMVFYMKVKR